MKLTVTFLPYSTVSTHPLEHEPVRTFYMYPSTQASLVDGSWYNARHFSSGYGHAIFFQDHVSNLYITCCQHILKYMRSMSYEPDKLADQYADSDRHAAEHCHGKSALDDR